MIPIPKPKLRCAFCGIWENQGKCLVKSQRADPSAICEDCISLASAIVGDYYRTVANIPSNDA